MTTREVMDFLKIRENTVLDLARQGFLRPGWACYDGGGNDWFADDVLRYQTIKDYGVTKDWVWAPRYKVLYCRAEPHVQDLGPAIQRLEAQKDRMLTWIHGRGMECDLVIKEVRPLYRYRDPSFDDTDTSGWQALLGLLSERRVATLYIESRDRLSVGPAWNIIEMLVKTGKCEIVVMNNTWPTEEMKAEAKLWMTDVLLLYKVLAGEIRKQSVVDTFIKGFDPIATMKLVHKVDAKLAQVRKTKNYRNTQWMRIPAKARVMDLDDCFDTKDIYQSRMKLGLPSTESPDPRPLPDIDTPTTSKGQ